YSGDPRLWDGHAGQARGRADLEQGRQGDDVLRSDHDRHSDGFDRRGQCSSGKRRRQWPPRTLDRVLLLCCLGWALSCNRGSTTPDLFYAHANRAFLHGDLKQSQDEAARGYQQFRDSHPEWASRFRVLEARAALWRGLYEEVLQLLSSATTSEDQPDFAIPALTLTGVAHTYLANFESAQRDIDNATRLCEG